MTKAAVLRKQESEENLTETEKETALTPPDFVRMEKNIAAFGFFTPSSKRIHNVPKVIKFKQMIDGKRIEAQVKIMGNVEYGMPITADQDKYLAFQKIVERIKREKGRVENPITFTTAELVKLLGKSRGGHHYKEVEAWLKLMKATVIESQGAIWIAGKKRFATDVFSLFDRVRKIGDELEDGTIADRNYVWLSEWYLENLNAHYLLPIDFETYKQLNNHVAKAFVPLLQIWLYASRDQGSFEKKYSELCQTLNISKYKYLSKIKEKLSPSLNELVEYGYLSSWAIEKTSDKKDFKIIFRHGWKFFSDRQIVTRSSDRILKAGEVGNGFSGKRESPSKVSEIIKTLQKDFRISREKAAELVEKFPEETVNQIEAFAYRTTEPGNPAGFLINAIERAYSLPDEYIKSLREKKDFNAKLRIKDRIKNCRLCDDSGKRDVKSDLDPMFGLIHECTHDPEIEAAFEDQII